MRSFADDLRYAIRQLANRPAFSIAAILSLALGLGANTTIFGVTNALLLQPMAVPRPDEMVKVYNGRHSPFGLADFEYFRTTASTLSHLIAEDQFPATMREGDEPERVLASVVTGDFWRALELKPQRGRFFTLARTDVSSATPVVVLSDTYWRRRFGGDPSVIGRTLRLGGTAVEVVGVAPPGFGSSIYGFSSDLWVSIADAPQVLGVPVTMLGGGLYTTGRLRAGVSREQANAEFQVLMERLRREQPEGHERMTVRIDHARGITAEIRGPVALATGFLLVITALVVLIACANVGNLLLARNTARRREIGIRVAMGAGRRRIIRQLLTESLVLALSAAAVGLVIAAWVGKALVRLIPADAPTNLTIAVNARVITYGVVVSGVALLAFALAPALRSSGAEVFSALRDDSRSVAGGRSRLRQGFLLAQVTLSTLLLAVAVLFVRSLKNAQDIDSGFDTTNLVSVDVNLRLGRYDQKTGTAMFDRIVEAMRGLPIVRGAALAATVPLAGSRTEWTSFREGDSPLPNDVPRPTVDVNIVSPSYFATIGIALQRGREFSADDAAGAPSVVVVNRTMAERLWPGDDPIGKRIGLDGPQGPWLEVVGVARDIKYNTLGESPTPVLYAPLAQRYRDHMLVQVRLAPGTSLNSARKSLAEVVASADPALPPATIQPVSDAQQLSLLPSKLGAGVLGIFGLLALTLAAVGIFGVTAFAVAQRTREIGIRTALGARSGAVIRAVLGQTAWTVSIGATFGIVAALGATQLLRSQLYGVGAVDPVTFALVPLVLGAVALLAAAIPARRAVRVDPVIALRAE